MGWEAGEGWVWASYRPARVVVPYGFGPPLTWDRFDAFRRKVWMRAGAPSAMNTEPGIVPMSAHARMFGALGPLLDTPSVYDLDSNEVREPGEEILWRESGKRLGIRYEFVGDAVTYAVHADSGFRRADGTPVVEPRVEFQGLLRVDGAGVPLAEADVPLSLQALYLLHEKTAGAAKGSLDPEVDRHLVHVRALADVLSRRGGTTVRAWLDLERVRDVLAPASAGGLGHLEPDDLLVLLDGDIRAWGADRPASRLGPALGIAPRHWGGRDAAGWGRTWTALDEALSVLSRKVGVPPNAADLTCLPVRGNEDAVGRAGSYLSGLATVATGDGVRAYRDGKLTLWTWEAEGIFHLAASRDGAGDTGRSDPLMTEGFASDAALRRLGVSSAAVGSLLGELDLGRLLAEREGVPDYAALGLLAAHEQGMTFADLCATQAEVIVWPFDDGERMWRIHHFQVKGADWSKGSDATLNHLVEMAANVGADILNKRIVMTLRSAGGGHKPLLERILRDHDDYAFGPADVVLGEALVKAAAAGATLADLAAVVAGCGGVLHARDVAA